MMFNPLHNPAVSSLTCHLFVLHAAAACTHLPMRGSGQFSDRDNWLTRDDSLGRQLHIPVGVE